MSLFLVVLFHRLLLLIPQKKFIPLLKLRDELFQKGIFLLEPQFKNDFVAQPFPEFFALSFVFLVFLIFMHVPMFFLFIVVDLLDDEGLNLSCLLEVQSWDDCITRFI